MSSRSPVLWPNQVVRPSKSLLDIEDFAAKLILLIQARGSHKPIRQSKLDELLLAANWLFEGLRQAFFSAPSMPMALPHGASAYSPKNPYRPPFSRGVLMQVIAAALEAGFIQLVKGKRQIEHQVGIISTVLPSGRFKQLLLNQGSSWLQLETMPVNSLVVMNNRKVPGSRRFVMDSEASSVKRYRTNLNKLNQFLVKQCLTIDLPDIWLQSGAHLESNHEDSYDLGLNPYRVQLYRVFAQDSLEKGGRFYGGWWQNLRSDFRKRIFINGYSSVEIDFDGLAISMLYAMVDAEPPLGDAYDIGLVGYTGKHDPRRKLVKQFVNASINDEVGTYRLGGKALRDLGLTTSELKKRLYKRHAPIAKFFGSGIGVKLQFLDSKIAEQIMLHFLNLDEVCLPIHDSFIVRKGLANELCRAMQVAYESIMRKPISVTYEGDYDGESIRLIPSSLLEMINSHSNQDDRIATLISHFDSYRTFVSWNASWENLMLPEQSKAHDERPINWNLYEHF